MFVYDNGKGTLEDNEIYGNKFSGIEIRTGGDPVVRRNRIHDGLASGVYVHGGGKGTFEKNELARNKMGAWNMEPESAPGVVRKDNIEVDAEPNK